jgi:hypothetical protein
VRCAALAAVLALGLLAPLRFSPLGRAPGFVVLLEELRLAFAFRHAGPRVVAVCRRFRDRELPRGEPIAELPGLRRSPAAIGVEAQEFVGGASASGARQGFRTRRFGRHRRGRRGFVVRELGLRPVEHFLGGAPRGLRRAEGALRLSERGVPDRFGGGERVGGPRLHGPRTIPRGVDKGAARPPQRGSGLGVALEVAGRCAGAALVRFQWTW